MRIVVTGATGYLGKKLVKRLKEEGHDIYAVVRASSDISQIKNIVLGVMQSIPYEELENKFDEISPEVYINLAGYYCGSHTKNSIGELLDANVMLPTFVMDAAIKSGCSHVIHTASVQQNYAGKNYDPVNLYAATKQAFEDILHYYTSMKKINAMTLQLYDTYGADDTRGKVFNLVRSLKAGESIAMSPGRQKLYFCYVDDVIDAYVHALELVRTDVMGADHKYAVRLEQPIELRKFVEKYFELMKKDVPVEWGKREYMAKEIMDPTGIGEILPGWEAKISYLQGLTLCSEYDRTKDRQCQ